MTMKLNPSISVLRPSNPSNYGMIRRFAGPGPGMIRRITSGSTDGNYTDYQRVMVNSPDLGLLLVP